MNTRRITLADVATAAGVSRTTASLVLTDRGDELRISSAVQDRVRRIAAELGYRPNALSAGLRRGTTRTLAFVSDTIATSQLAGDMIKGALARADEHGYLLFIGESEGDPAAEKRLIEAMLDRQVDGFIVASMFTRERPFPALLRGRPTVLLNAVPTRRGTVPAVVPAERDAGARAARELLAAGHHRIHLIGTGLEVPADPRGALAGRARLEGILDALRAAGVEPASAQACPVWLPENGFDAMRTLLERGVRGEAVITFNDRLAFGVYEALQEEGLRVPDDMSVVSFDDHQLATWLRPGLSTFALPHRELGAMAVDLVLDAMGEGGGDPSVVELPMPLRSRGSVRPAGA